MIKTQMQADFFSERYPYNVQPRVEYDETSKDYPNKTAVPDFSKQFIIFDNNEVQVIKGKEIKNKVSLKHFFVPINNSMITEYKLLSNVGKPPDTFYTLNYGIVGTTISFLMLFPDYTLMSNQEQNLWQIEWRMQGQTEWNSLGRILVLSTLENSVPVIELRNTMAYDVTLHIMAAS